ncbi:CHAD domain protein [Pseudobythopirellula maris]|uniref:CHAD domain protein n=1 Tax=Pseudobythopirellula maris TaxID=2527991 RepID=A0A5C5ZN07_9BACT|nr:CHAD domain-containing protein [Pseudobythopirellula maris]TWT88819.1 CHAD domain protein [Pseudobythopirellula maris]
MSYRIQQAESPADALRRIASEQFDKAITEIDSARLEPEEKVHQTRKRLKKLRGLLRLVRPGLGKTYKKENARLRDAARGLSELRDAKVMQDTYDMLMGHFADQVERRAFGSIRAELTRRRNSLIETTPPEERLGEARRVITKAAGRTAGWSIDDEGFEAVRGGLLKTYGRARKQTKRAHDSPTPECLHRLRKRVKYHRRHCQLLKIMWPQLLKARARECKRLADLLGDDHDLAMLGGCLAQQPQGFGDSQDTEAAIGLISRRREGLLDESLPLADRLFCETTDALGKRTEALWNVWR